MDFIKKTTNLEKSKKFGIDSKYDSLQSIHKLYLHKFVEIKGSRFKEIDSNKVHQYSLYFFDGREHLRQFYVKGTKCFERLKLVQSKKAKLGGQLMVFIRKSELRALEKEKVNNPLFNKMERDRYDQQSRQLLSDTSRALGEIITANKKSDQACSRVVEKIVKSSMNTVPLFKAMTELMKIDDSIFNKSVYTAFLVSKFSILQKKSPHMTYLLCYAGFLSRVGLYKIHPETKRAYEARSSVLTHEQTKEYERYPRYGFDLIHEVNDQGGKIPDVVANFVMEHRENMLGDGFPRQLKNTREANPVTGIMEPARVLKLAFDFSELFVQKKGPMKGLITMIARKQDYDPKLFDAFVMFVTKELLSEDEQKHVIAKLKKSKQNPY